MAWPATGGGDGLGSTGGLLLEGGGLLGWNFRCL